MSAKRTARLLSKVMDWRIASSVITKGDEEAVTDQIEAAVADLAFLDFTREEILALANSALNQLSTKRVRPS